MYIDYSDIRSRIAEAPLWWLYGMPRYAPFDPDELNVYARQSVLVHTECQHCRCRYEVGVHYPSPHHRYDFRDVVAYQARLDIGDPPNACCSYTSMTSIEFGILEFWEKEPFGHNWRRDMSMEGPLAGVDFYEDVEAPKSMRDLIKAAGLNSVWTSAWRASERSTMQEVLESVGCRRITTVLDMIEHQRAIDAFDQRMVERARQRQVERDAS